MDEKKYNVDYAKKYYLNNKKRILKYQKEYYDENNTHRKKQIPQSELIFKFKKEVFVINFI
jgi:hypothetical protein